MVKNEQWEYVHRFLVNVSNGYYQHPDNRRMSRVEAKITLSVIAGLVHEIERLEGEIIRLRDEANMWKHKHGYVTTEMRVSRPQTQPFYMEYEE